MKPSLIRVLLCVSFFSSVWVSKAAAQMPAAGPVLNVQVQAGGNVEAVAVIEQAQDPATLANRIQNELKFLQAVVELTSEQVERLSSFDVEKLKELRIEQRKVAAGVDFAPAPNIVTVQVQPSQNALQIRQAERAFEKEVKATLSAEQYDTYTREKKLRDDFYLEAAVRGLLIFLDKKFGLTSHQRDSLSEALTKWGGITTFDIAQYENNPRFMPNIPESILMEHLEDRQKQIYQSSFKIDFKNTLPLQNFDVIPRR